MYLIRLSLRFHFLPTLQAIGMESLNHFVKREKHLTRVVLQVGRDAYRQFGTPYSNGKKRNRKTTVPAGLHRKNLFVTAALNGNAWTISDGTYFNWHTIRFTRMPTNGTRMTPR